MFLLSSDNTLSAQELELLYTVYGIGKLSSKFYGDYINIGASSIWLISLTSFLY